MGIAEIANTYYKGIADVAKDLSVSTVPAVVSGRDMWLRNWFAYSVCIPRYKNGKFLVSRNCFSVLDFSFIEKFSSCTLFLDKIELLKPDLQEKLVLLISAGYFEKQNVKLVLGTEIGIVKLSEISGFNQDLLFKMNQVPVKLVEINDRKDDILPLAEYFLAIEKTRTGKLVSGFSDSAREALVNHYWAGLESELKNAVERAVLLCEGETIGAKDLGLSSDTDDSTVEKIAGDIACGTDEDKTLKNAVDLFKRAYIKRLLEQNGNNQTKVAKILNIQRTYVSRLLNELHIR